MFEQEISEVQIKIGNFISSTALASCGFWNTPFHIFTQNGNPFAVLKSLDDYKHALMHLFERS
jgi:hypothetical protein